MADIRLTGVDGLNALIDGLTDTEQRIDRDAPDIVQRAGSRYQSRAKFFVPVDTGELRGSIRVHPDGPLAVTVTAHANHAGWVEFGTSRQSPQSYMGPAEATVTPEVVDEFGELGRRIL